MERKKSLKLFWESALQGILYSMILFAYIRFLMSLADTTWNLAKLVDISLIIVIPVSLACILCLCMNRKHLGIDPGKLLAKEKLFRLGARLLFVACFLFVGYIVDINTQNMYFNGSEGMIETLEVMMLDITYYILISLFPIAYALLEYLFVVENAG